MNKAELIAELRTKFYGVNEAGIHEGNTEAEITVWGIGVFEKIGDVVRKMNLTFYTKGEDAFWGVSEPNPTPITPEPTFTDRVNAFIASKITADPPVIKFGYIEQISKLTKKALCAAVLSDNSEKMVLVSEDAAGVFSIEVL